MATILDMTQDLVRLADSGQAEEAVATYFADDVRITESTGEASRGRDTQIERLRQFQQSIKEMHDSGTLAVGADEERGVSFVEGWMDATMQDGSRMKMQEVERYQWKDGKIVDAFFYYPTGEMPSES